MLSSFTATQIQFTMKLNIQALIHALEHSSIDSGDGVDCDALMQTVNK